MSKTKLKYVAVIAVLAAIAFGSLCIGQYTQGQSIRAVYGNAIRLEFFQVRTVSQRIVETLDQEQPDPADLLSDAGFLQGCILAQREHERYGNLLSQCVTLVSDYARSLQADTLSPEALETLGAQAKLLVNRLHDATKFFMETVADGNTNRMNRNYVNASSPTDNAYKLLSSWLTKAEQGK